MIENVSNVPHSSLKGEARLGKIHPEGERDRVKRRGREGERERKREREREILNQ